MRRLLSLLPRLWANWITLLGTVITTVSAFAMLVFLLLEMFAARSNPYGGIFAVLLPMGFVAGLLIIPLGFFVERRMQRRDGKGIPRASDAITKAFMLAVSDPRARRLILFVGALSVINVTVIAVGGVRAMNYMDTQQFCGLACHVPMQPEWTAFQRSPHRRIECVQCHIGPGAGALVAAKLNGMHQLFGVIFHSYHRPIPAPVAHMRSDEVTCEGCHSRARFIGDVPKMFPHYRADKGSSPSFNVMIDHVGGFDPKAGKYTGMHSHLAPNRRVDFEYLDEKRTQIGKITLIEDGKVAAEYVLPGDDGKRPALGSRTLECTDCHNRPAHRFDGTARQAVEKALWNGELDSTQPYVAKVSSELLEKAEVPGEGALAYFKLALPEAYGALDARPLPSDEEKLAAALAAIYRRNVFPTMNVTWNTYADLIGHYSEHGENVGCMRCHDGKHQAPLANGKVKKMDNSCDLCHAPIESGVAPDKFEDPVKQMVGIALD